MLAQEMVDFPVVGVHASVRVVRLGVDFATRRHGRLDLGPDQFETGQDVGRRPVRALARSVRQSPPPSEASSPLPGA